MGGGNMIVTFIAQDQISTISLPERISGRYFVSAKSADGLAIDVADVEGIQGQWILHSSPILTLLDEHTREISEGILAADKQVIHAKYRETGQTAQFYVEPATEDRRKYQKYCVQEECRLNIGRAPDNQIIFENRYVSAHHACLIWKDGIWSISDMQSRNGTFLNERRIATKKLLPGDTVYIMGLKIIVGNGFFALNNPDQAVSISSSSISTLARQEADVSAQHHEPSPSPETFLSAPRIRRTFERKSLTVDPPPLKQQPETTPLALLLGPALTMGMTAVVMGAVAVINLQNGTSTMLTSLPTIIMSFSMLCGTLLWPMLTKRSETKRQARAELEQQKKYREYLDRVRDEIHRIGQQQKSVLLENCPSIEECADWIRRRDKRLWGRSAAQDDFLSLRIGHGDLPLDAEVKFPDKRFTLEADPLLNDVNRLADTPLMISDAPVTCPLNGSGVVGIAGKVTEARALLQSLVVQISALYSSEQVKLAFFVDENGQAAWNCFRLLPHVWDEASNLRCFAVGGEEGKTVSMSLERIFAEREDAHSSCPEKVFPQYVLIAADPIIAERVVLFSKIASAGGTLGFSGIVASAQVSDLPKFCSMVIELSEQNAVAYDKDDFSGTKRPFVPELMNLEEPEELCGVLANLAVRSQAEKYELPNWITFLELYGGGKVEHLNVLSRWRENSPVNTLRAPIGINQDGTALCLDLHEKAHGPHGLIAGMTGSGKSELIITYLLSMAVNYRPDEVSFILIDYKGGGLAGAFEDEENAIRLPHLAGTITNLDGTEVNRSLISIQSELLRRQAIFNEAKKATGEGTMDIYKYQKLYRSGIVHEPVPHLLVVSDEFAELKAQQPNFMSQLISAARIGRSLGVHLILATQKPSGVVDDQIWSNSRFRICLKVQERADSMEMLKQPDAAELKDTGRFYLQVGYNELFELGQSAWCGAPYIPVECLEKKQDKRVEVIDHIGRVLLETRPKVSGTAGGTSQVVSIVKYLAALADAEHVSARRLWLPPIPALIYLEPLIQKYSWTAAPLGLEPIIGEYDNPFSQSQGLLTIPFSRSGNALLYGAAGSGKTTLLDTMLVCLLRSYTADQLNIYIMDLGEETLRIFANAPQVGDVLLSTDGEKILNLFKMLQNEIAARKKRFTEGDGSYESYCRKTGEDLPQILVILRNYSAFAEQFEALDDQLIQITRECNKYGIYFLVTANAANTIRYRVAQNFGGVYALQLNDPSDYIGLFSGTGGIYPPKIKGRGIFKEDRVYEFQAAHFAQDASQSVLRAFVNGLSRGTGTCACPVPTLPARVVPSFLPSDFTESAVPVGVEKASLRISTWNVSRFVISMVLSQDAEELGAAAQGIVEQLSKLSGSVTVFDGAELMAESKEMSYSYLRVNFAGHINSLFQEMVHRNNLYKRAAADGRDAEDYDPEYYVLTGLPTIFSGLSEADKDKLNTLLEKAELHYRIKFILCGSPKEVSEFNTAGWYRRHVSGNNGIWVGDGITDQYCLKIAKLTNSLYSEIPPHFGYLVKRGKPALVKLIVGEDCEEEAEN